MVLSEVDTVGDLGSDVSVDVENVLLGLSAVGAVGEVCSEGPNVKILLIKNNETVDGVGDGVEGESNVLETIVSPINEEGVNFGFNLGFVGWEERTHNKDFAEVGRKLYFWFVLISGEVIVEDRLHRTIASN